MATEVQLRETLDREGLTIAAGTGASNAHPALRAPSDARAQAARLLDALGSRVSQGISGLFGNPQVQNGISNFFKAASGSFNGKDYSGLLHRQRTAKAAATSTVSQWDKPWRTTRNSPTPRSVTSTSRSA
ncbi:hypothetical protein [Burkholderia ambifaria]|uniref:hypothetical protein n=1 Tax=Burkholderia ambifaria TaxID=152480 RepID=UPI00312C91D2